MCHHSSSWYAILSAGCILVQFLSACQTLVQESKSSVRHSIQSSQMDRRPSQADCRGVHIADRFISRRLQSLLRLKLVCDCIAKYRIVYPGINTFVQSQAAPYLSINIVLL
jgi:hypothetical protein